MNRKTNMQELFEDLQKNKRKLIIFGAGGLLCSCIDQINTFLKILCDDWKTPEYIMESGTYYYDFRKIEEYIEFIVDNDMQKRKLGNWIIREGEPPIPIYGTDIFEKIDLDKFILLITTRDYEEEIKNQIAEIDILKEMDYYGFFSDLHHYEKNNRGLIVERVILPYLETMQNPYYQKNIREDEYDREYKKVLKYVEAGKYIMNVIAFEITTVCNLKCKYCGEHIPYLPEKGHLEINKILEDIDIFLSVVDLVFCVTLTTGEVLFYPELKKILNKLIANDKVERIDLVTNGIAVPKDEELMTLLTHPKIMLNMSDYNMPERTQNNRKYYLEHGIDLRFMENQKWDISFGKVPEFICGFDKEKLENKYLNCSMAKYCSQLISNGKIYACGKIRRFIQITDFQTRHDYIELKKSKDLKQNLIDFKLENYMEGCAWCPINMENSKIIVPGEQLVEGK